MATVNKSTGLGLLATASPSSGSRLTGKAQSSINIIHKKFLVHFRRPKDYDGSYGFDWFQPEFENYDSSFDLKKREYKPTKIFGEEYLTPWLSIAKGQTIRVNLVIDELGGTAPLSDNDIIKLLPQKGIRFTPEEIKAKNITGNVSHFPTGTEKGMEIEIICDDTVSFDSIVNVYNQDDAVIGRLSLFKSDKKYVMPIRVVQLLREGHVTNDEELLLTHLINAPDFRGCFEIGECMKRLEEHMNKYAYNQAFVRCEMERGSDNVIKTHTVTINETEWIRKNHIDDNGRIIKRDNLIFELLDLYKIQIEKKVENRFFRGIIMFIANFEAEERKITEAGEITYRTLGIGNANIIDDRNCILFKNGGVTNMNTCIHEIGHVLSLAHPFEIWNVQEIQVRELEVKKINAYLKNPNVLQHKKNSYFTKTIEDYCKITNRMAWLYYRNKYTFIGNGTKEKPQEDLTKMYMDYVASGQKDERKFFTQWQWRTIQECVKRFFSNI